jgi:hypothetical protein
MKSRTALKKKNLATVKTATMRRTLRKTNSGFKICFPNIQRIFSVTLQAFVLPRMSTFFTADIYHRKLTRVAGQPFQIHHNTLLLKKRILSKNITSLSSSSLLPSHVIPSARGECPLETKNKNKYSYVTVFALSLHCSEV